MLHRSECQHVKCLTLRGNSIYSSDEDMLTPDWNFISPWKRHACLCLVVTFYLFTFPHLLVDRSRSSLQQTVTSVHEISGSWTATNDIKETLAKETFLSQLRKESQWGRDMSTLYTRHQNTRVLWPSTTASAVYLHLKDEGHLFEDNKVHILDREDR